MQAITLFVKPPGVNKDAREINIAKRVQALLYAFGIKVAVKEDKTLLKPFRLYFNKEKLTVEEAIRATMVCCQAGVILSSCEKLWEYSLRMAKPEDWLTNIESTKERVKAPKGKTVAYWQELVGYIKKQFYPVTLKREAPDWDLDKKEPVALKRLVALLENKVKKSDQDTSNDYMLDFITGFLELTVKYPFRKNYINEFSINLLTYKFDEIYNHVYKQHTGGTGAGFSGLDHSFDKRAGNAGQ